MVVGEVATRTEVLVIGGGPGGYAAAIRAAQLGRQVTLVERNALGGACLNVGCIPSKVFIHAADLAHLPNTIAGTGVTLSASVDLAAVREHMASVVKGLTGGVSQLLISAGVEVAAGTARFSRRNRAAVVSGENVRHIEFDEAIVATGSRPIELPDLPFTDDRIVDSTGALFSFDHVPPNLVVVGGGYIGIEIGTAWAKLGSKVTIIEREAGLLPGLDSRLGRVVTRRLAELGVTVMTNATARHLADQGLIVDTGGENQGQQIVPADKVLVAVGRRPNTDDLGLDVMRIELDDAGRIPVDAARRAGARVLAIGDVTDGPALAHKATAEADAAAHTAAGQDGFFDPAAVPAVVFSDPEVATVGLTADEAAAAGAEVKRFTFPLTASGRARTVGATAGQIEVVADAAGTVLGAHMAGPHVSEVIGEATLAIEMAVTVDELAAVIHAHPTISEGLLEAAHGLLGMPLHVPASR